MDEEIKISRNALSKNFFEEKDKDGNLKIGTYKNLEMWCKDPLLLDRKIDIFKDRVDGWFFDVAQRLKADNEAGFVILMISLAHIEMMVQLINSNAKGDGGDVKFFKKYLIDLFKVTDPIAGRIYGCARCGIVHDMMTKRGINISCDILEEIKILDDDIIIINPHRFLDKLRFDFNKYIKKLSDAKEVEKRKLFEKFWDKQVEGN